MFPVAILAGGMATRMWPNTERCPKALLDVGGKPFIDHQLLRLRDNGIERVVICVGYLGEQIIAHVGDGRQFGLQVSYSHDGEKLCGTGGALKRALPKLVLPQSNEAFFVLYGDSYLLCDFASVQRSFQEANCQGMMTVYQNHNAFDRSNVWFTNGQIRKYSKTQQIVDMKHIDYGLGILSAQALRSFSLDQFDLAAVYQKLLAEKQLAAYEVFERFYEIGSPQGLQQTIDFLQAKSAD